MKTYISILRGINVSGQKSIEMADLKKLYESLNFKDINSYIQSGNIIFKTDKKLSEKEITTKIQEIIKSRYNFEVPVIIRTAEEISDVMVQNPFLKDNTNDRERLHVTFLEDIPFQETKELISAIDYSPDKFLIIGREIYLYCPNGYGISKLSNTFFEKKLKLSATTRNWKTVLKLAELSAQ